MSNGVDFKKIALENQDLLNAAPAREAALREELATIYSDRDAEKEMKAKAREQRDVKTIRACELQQRLGVAEQRLSQVEGACDLVMSAIDDDERGANFVEIIQAIKDKAALKPAEEGEGK